MPHCLLLFQVNTLALHLLEQVEMNIFGGTASFSLLSGFIQISKSLMAFGFLCFISKTAKRADPNGTQNVFFSIFTAAAVAVSYLLSRYKILFFFIALLTELFPLFYQ